MIFDRGTNVNGNGKHTNKEKLPAHRLDAERAVIGAAMRDNTVIDPAFRPEFFYVVAHQRIYEAILALLADGKPADVVTICAMLAQAKLLDEIGGSGYIADLFADAPSDPSNFKHHAAIVREKAVNCSMVKFVEDIRTQAYDEGTSASDILATAQNRLAEITSAYQSSDESEFGEPVIASALDTDQDDQLAWIWRGLIPDKGVVMFSALWKAGKTTLLSILLKASANGVALCGQEVAPATILFISEENSRRWRKRRDKLGIQDNVYFWCRPFKSKPTMARWRKFLEAVRVRAVKIGANLVVFDTISALWSARDENNAGEVQEALMPLWTLTPHTAIALVHHLKKADGAEGTGSRGSGALPSFVDTIIELQRHDPHKRACRKRVLSAYGRDDDTPAEIVIELQQNGLDYITHGSRQAERDGVIRQALCRILPTERPGLDFDGIKEAWPEDEFPTKAAILDVLAEGAERGDWTRDGAGRKGDPYRYLRLSATGAA